MAQQSAAQAQQGAAFPLFYRKPFALQAQVHSDISLKRLSNYRFAQGANAIPLTTTELFHAQRDYPIVFTDEPVPLPMAVVGIQDRVNLFVEPDGSWRRGTYIPAYVRRYPFLFAEQPVTKDLTLCIDEASELIEATKDNPFFRNGQPTEITQKALEFCLAYQRQHEATREFGRTLAQVELLAGRDARVQISPQETVLVRGFKMIDEEKFNQLPAETFLEWRTKGWIALIYSHLLSLGAWDKLVQIVNERRGAAR
ncbi:MAG TPA: SapC family protein [Stellaceae bacterium]|nr:SapC family protein [Stellaceae bacterium]